MVVGIMTSGYVVRALCITYLASACS
jgi:hypothetical protein